MAIAKDDQRVLRALSAARAEHEELAELLDFYFDLYEVQFRAKAEIPEPEVRDDLAMSWRVEGGIPQLTFDQLRIEPETFSELVTQVKKVLFRHNPGWQQEREVPGPNELVDLAQRVFETWDTLTSPKPAPAETGDEELQADHATALAVGFALAPYLQRASELIMSDLDLTMWSQSHCPICGGRPNFTILSEESGARELMCSRCASLWSYPRIGCPFCETEERPIFYPSEDGLHRLYVCGSCNRYLKGVDLRKARRVVYPRVERLLTVGMDLAAHQEGYEG